MDGSGNKQFAGKRFEEGLTLFLSAVSEKTFLHFEGQLTGRVTHPYSRPSRTGQSGNPVWGSPVFFSSRRKEQPS